MKQRWMIQAAGVASALTLLAGTAQAQVCGTAPLPECCVLGPVALPGLSGPPEWEDFDGDGFWRPELHDPRWSGAPLEFLTMLPDSGSPAWADDVGVRFLTQGNHLYVSYQVQVDDNGPSASDFVYLALTNGGANSAVALKVSAAAGGAAIGAPPASPTGFVPADTPLPTRAPDAAVVHWTTGDASVDSPSWEERLTTPTWLVGAARWDRAGVGSPRWAITLRIDLARLPFSPGNFRAFFGAQVNRSTGDVLVGNRRPRTDADSDRIPTTIIPHKLGDWAEYRAPGTSCPAGIRLSPSDVGVWTGSPGSTSPGSLTNRICAGESCGSGNNVFRVTARGVPNMGLSPFSVRARLRIADWGASVAHWNYGRWRDITKTPAGTDVFSAPSTAFTAANGWHWLTPVDAGDGTSSITIDYVCDKGSDAYCPKLEDESEDHQCMLVEVGQLGALAQFQRTAVYRNMEYEELSTLERRARKLSLIQLPDPPSRD
nr:MAG: hypothetical protein DIU78_03050 [Pseudomonadota bacterium]